MGKTTMSANKAYEGEGRPRSTIYEFSDGRKEKWIGGSPAWRNNNPGNLRPAKAYPGYIGEAWGFAVFPDIAAGKLAMREQLKRPFYSNLSLETAIYRYAPPSDNNPTERYIDFIVERTGVSRKTIMGSLSDTKLMTVVEAMMAFEHAIEGEIVILKPKKPLKTGFYIWRTEHDEKVRGAHAARDGKIFNFHNPPPGGNPGEDYNCRCSAEPIPAMSLDEVFKK